MSNWLPQNCPVPGARAYYDSDSRCAVILGHEPIGPGGELRWHLSISHAKRYPTWKEIKEARYFFIPDNVTMAMLLPPQAEYVNAHPNCFHLHEFIGNEIITKLA
jgi:hypothetical protein